MKNKDHMLLEQLYSKVKPINILNEEANDNRFTAEIESVSVYNVDTDSYSLGIENNKLTLVYEVEFEYRSWGIKDFRVVPKKILPFTILIEDDYNEEDFSESKPLVEFSNGVDASEFKVSNVELKHTSSLFPTRIDVYIKKIGDKWEVVPQESEIYF